MSFDYVSSVAADLQQILSYFENNPCFQNEPEFKNLHDHGWEISILYDLCVFIDHYGSSYSHIHFTFNEFIELCKISDLKVSSLKRYLDCLSSRGWITCDYTSSEIRGEPRWDGFRYKILMKNFVKLGALLAEKIIELK